MNTTKKEALVTHDPAHVLVTYEKGIREPTDLILGKCGPRRGDQSPSPFFSFFFLGMPLGGSESVMALSDIHLPFTALYFAKIALFCFIVLVSPPRDHFVRILTTLIACFAALHQGSPEKMREAIGQVKEGMLRK